MTSDELAEYRPPSSDLTVSRPSTDDWYASFPNIVKLAEYVADTEFVPDAMRRHPAAIAAAILTGREMGLPPMVSLRHLFVVRGRVGQSAELMRAQIYRAGHEIKVVEATDQRCIVEGRRKDEKDWTRTQFTAEDARHAGIDLRGYPADKLFARATSRLARRKFPDAVMGLPTVDELEDSSAPAAIVELAETMPVQRKRATRKAKAAATQPKPAEPAPPAEDDTAELLDEQPPSIAELLDDDGAAADRAYDQADKARRAALDDIPVARPPATLHSPTAGPPNPQTPQPDNFRGGLTRAAAAPGPDQPDPDQLMLDEPEEPATQAQNRRMHAAFRQIGATDRADRLAITSRILGWDVGTSRALTKSEAGQLIDTLDAWTSDPDYPVAERVNDILNEAALAEAERDTPPVDD